MDKKINSSQSVSSKDIQAVIQERRHPQEKVYFGILATVGFLLVALSFGLVIITRLSMMLMLYTRSMPLAIFYALQPLLIYLCVIISIILLMAAIVIGVIRGNTAKITAKQFPAIYAIMEKQAKTLGMSTVPTGYVLNGNGILQAFALRFLRGNYVILFSDLVATAKKDESVLAFIIGHELAHIKLRHTSFTRNFFLVPLPILSKAYSRSREYSCDAIAQYLVPKGAEKGIILLAVGKHLFQEVDVDEYIRSAKEDEGFATWVSELFSTHPHLSSRLEAVRKWAKK